MSEAENIVSLENGPVLNDNGELIEPQPFPDHWARQVTLVLCKVSKVDRKSLSVSLSFKRKQVHNITLNFDMIETLESFYRYLCEQYSLLDEKFLLWANLPNHPGPIYDDQTLYLAMQLPGQRTRIIVGTLNVTFQKRLGIGTSDEIVGPTLSRIYEAQGETMQARNPVDAILDRQEADDLAARAVVLRDAEDHPVIRGDAAGDQDDAPLGRVPVERPSGEERNLLDLVYIPVWRRYAVMLLGLNGLLYTMETHLSPRRRVGAIDEGIIAEIVEEVLTRHAFDDEDD